MPWHATRSDQCPADRPWAVIKDDDGSVVACHATEDAANEQVAALYANEPDARSVAMPDPERVEARSAAFTDVDVSKDGWSFDGLAAVYDQEADLGEWTEEQARGAYRKVLAKGENVPMLYHHNPMLPVLATTRALTLQLRDDAKGLRVKATIAKHFVGEAVRELVSRGDITGMSNGFIVGAGNSRIESRGRSGKPHRVITDFRALLDVSPTWDPAYAGTTAELRSLSALAAVEDIEQVQQALVGASPQHEERAPVDPEDAGTGDPEPDTPPETVAGESGEKEERAGVDAANAAAAARRRRLQMMGLSLPQDDKTWLASGSSEERSVASSRGIDELLRYPRETWSVEEQQHVVERRGAVHAEMFALTSEAERTGRNLTLEERERFESLRDEYQRLAR